MYQSVEAIAEPSGVVRLLETVPLTRPTRAVVTFLVASPHASTVPTPVSPSIVAWLDNNALPPAAIRNHQDIEDSISELRHAWD